MELHIKINITDTHMTQPPRKPHTYLIISSVRQKTLTAVNINLYQKRKGTKPFLLLYPYADILYHHFIVIIVSTKNTTKAIRKIFDALSFIVSFFFDIKIPAIARSIAYTNNASFLIAIIL